MQFSIGDIIYVPDMCSIHSMIYYGEHKIGNTCPCTWRHLRGRVIEIHGNFVRVEDINDSEHRSVFYHSDINVIAKDKVDATNQ